MYSQNILTHPVTKQICSLVSIPCSKRRFFFSFLSSFLFSLASVKSECLLFSQLSSPLSRPPPPPLPPKQPPTPPPLPCKLHETAKLDHRNTNSANNMKYVKGPTKILKTFFTEASVNS